MLKEHLGGKSYRTLEDDYEINSKTTCSLTNTVTKQLIHSKELTKLMNPLNYCGVMLIDGKYVPVKHTNKEKIKGLIPCSKKRRGKTKTGLTVLPFMYYETHDIPVYIIAHSENMFEIREGFRQLKEMNYPLKILVCDESMGEIAKVAKEFYPDVVIQTCLIHYIRNIDKEFKVNEVRRRMNAIKRKLENIGDSILIPTRRYDIEKARKLTNQLADLEFEYGYLIKVQEIFQEVFCSVKTKEELSEVEDRLNIVISHINLDTYPHANKIRKRYLDYYSKRHQIITSSCHPDLNIPRTTNLIEGFNSTTLEMRFTTIRGFEKEGTARSYINSMILKYRFHKFKCCKNKFKHLNGKSPLEISKPLHNLKNLCSKDWVKLCRKFKS